MDAHMEGSLVKEDNIYKHIQGTRENTELHRLTGVLQCKAIFPVQYCDYGSGGLLKLRDKNLSILSYRKPG